MTPFRTAREANTPRRPAGGAAGRAATMRRHMPVRHCVIPAAGLGTRFLPATKALPKELLPVLDRPVLQWGVEEAVAAGADTMVVVTSRGKELLAAHFDSAPELERTLESRGKLVGLEAVRRSQRLARFA